MKKILNLFFIFIISLVLFSCNESVPGEIMINDDEPVVIVFKDEGFVSLEGKVMTCTEPASFIIEEVTASNSRATSKIILTEKKTVITISDDGTFTARIQYYFIENYDNLYVDSSIGDVDTAYYSEYGGSITHGFYDTDISDYVAYSGYADKIYTDYLYEGKWGYFEGNSSTGNYLVYVDNRVIENTADTGEEYYKIDYANSSTTISDFDYEDLEPSPLSPPRYLGKNQDGDNMVVLYFSINFFSIYCYGNFIMTNINKVSREQ